MELKISVIVPGYNEESVIRKNMERIVKELGKRPDDDWELIMVNDGSSDKTGELMDEFAKEYPRVKILHHRRNWGQGRALKTAFKVCKGEIIVTLDADLSYSPEYIDILSKTVIEQNVDIALASPYVKGGSVANVPFYRLMLSRIGNKYLSKLGRYSINTSTCVVRAYRSEVLGTLALTSDGMELQIEILMKSSMMGFKVYEVPARLEWAIDKTAKAGASRVSKMCISRTIRLYLLMGWLSRPAGILMVLSIMLFVPSLLGASAIVYRVAEASLTHMNEGVLIAWSISMQEVFARYTYGVIIYGILILISIQLFAFSLVLLQNKFYFEELFKLQQELKSIAEAKRK